MRVSWMFLIIAILNFGCSEEEFLGLVDLNCTGQSQDIYQIASDPLLDFDQADVPYDRTILSSDCSQIPTSTASSSTLMNMQNSTGSSTIRFDVTSDNRLYYNTAGTTMTGVPVSGTITGTSCDISFTSTGTINSAGQTITTTTNFQFQGLCPKSVVEAFTGVSL